MKYDPWYKASYELNARSVQLKLNVPHDVFSTLRIDEGTLLLLDHLPKDTPRAVLDVGCGYGALGLPVARLYPGARIEMLDRDLLAVAWSAHNARENQLANVVAYGSLGLRDLPRDHPVYDWILCNVPARIGRPFIRHLLQAGRTLLAPGGELRVVVIRDLVPLLEEIRTELGCPLKEVAMGPRHSVFSLAADASQPSPIGSALDEPPGLYARDIVEIAGLKLERPFDLGGDDPKRLVTGLPVLLDALPRQAPGRVFCFRSGYGVLPLVGRTRWPEAQIVAVDRDLLATTYTRRNADRLGLAGAQLDVREASHFPDAFGAKEKFDLVIGELSPSAGDAVMGAEILAISKVLNPGGQALLLTLDKTERQWLRPFTRKHPLSIHRMISRDGYSVLLLTGSKLR